MTKVSLSTRLPVLAPTVWDLIGGFNNLAEWHPAVAKSEETKGGAATIRRLTLHGGGTIVERLESKDDKRRTYSAGPRTTRRRPGGHAGDQRGVCVSASG